jgi:hypothetical protein
MRVAGVDGHFRGQAELGKPVGRPPVRVGVGGLAHQDLAVGSDEANCAFGGHGGRPERPSRHHAETLPVVGITGRILGAGAHDLCPLAHPEPVTGVAQEFASALRGIEQDPVEIGPIHEDHQARKSTARSQIEEPNGPRHDAYEGARVLQLGREGPWPQEAEGSRVAQDGLEGRRGRGTVNVVGHRRVPSGGADDHPPTWLFSL